ncbi:MAG: nucleotidyltransferase domain-containing protein [Candidatus Gastranaerophilales bacterium]|nr:nucleotidyltransferase domain-containing protein [Candidatus Gastranaerophilales bacterium]
MDKTINTLIDELKNIFKERLVSVILYGSYASGNYQKGISDINLLVILDKLKSKDLKIANTAMKKWKKTGNPVPLFMDKDEWPTSCDVYAIEYSDIKERHKLLYGEDLVSSLSVEKNYLRLQCESEIKNLLVKLRQAYLANSDNIKVIDNIIKKSSTSFITVFRAVLRILDENVPPSHREVVDLFASKVNIDKDIFIEILELREKNRSISKDKIEDIIQKLIDSLYQALIFIDKI